MAVCEGSGAGDEGIDAAWIHEGTLFFLETRYAAPSVTNGDEPTFRVPTFGPEGAEQLKEGFDRIRSYVKGETRRQARKYILLSELYEQATGQNLRIELVVAIGGTAKKPLIQKVKEINEEFEGNRKDFPKHHVSIYDLEWLNQKVSDSLARPPGTVYLETLNWFEIKNSDKESTYAFATNVAASEVVRIRKECGYSIYHSNFRFMLARGVARGKIQKTLETPSERLNFWRYNNGITVSCERVTRIGNSDKFEITALQVVNGLQTIETLYDNMKNPSLLEGATLLVRIIPTKQLGSDIEAARKLEERIAEYSNSQTPITPRDLRSNDPVQRAIQLNMLEIYGIEYIRKAGRTQGGPRGRPSRDRIENVDAAQAALSFWYGLAREAKGKKKLLFEMSTSAVSGYYDKVFNDDTLAEYVLLPYLLWENEYIFIDKVKDKERYGAYRALDLLALSVVGELFMRTHALGRESTKKESTQATLRIVIQFLRDATDRKSSVLANEIWKPVLETLFSIVLARRVTEARTRGFDDPEDITLRNVIVKMGFNEDSLRKQVMRARKVKSLLKRFRVLFSD